MKKSEFIAHVRGSDGETQLLKSHLLQVAEIAAMNAKKIDWEEAGYVLGLFHDMGKYSKEFQSYIGSATGIINPDEDDYIDVEGKKGKIDHSSAGAQYLWRFLRNIGGYGQGELSAQVLALCIASHHSGLINVLHEDGTVAFTQRMDKEDDKTNFQESFSVFKAELKDFFDRFSNKEFVKQIFGKINEMVLLPKKSTDKLLKLDAFTLGMLVRFLFSCLIDADRLDSAEFENPFRKKLRLKRAGWKDWSVAIERFEKKIIEFEQTKPIDGTRKEISEICKSRAYNPQGIYTLTVPTGGGKTLSSLRYALHHAAHYNLDRIIYIIPYTSIIEQNAKAVREFLELPGDEFDWVLEHHSNVEPDTQTWQIKLVSENWDVPIVFITSVQFLETLFSGGTRGARRMHQLAKSVMIFDEIQTLPINCAHLFCNALNFLIEQAGSTAVLCTATQPLLDKLPASEYGTLKLAENSELNQDKQKHFNLLNRVDIKDKIKNSGWSDKEICGLALNNLIEKGSCLVIVNTKKWAQKLYQLIKCEIEEGALFHLSTNQYPIHRKELLKKVKGRLDKKQPVLCISTQLIEAGVDIDFSSVIRFVAGLDSIAQAAGRCNRHGLQKNDLGEFINGNVYVVNPDYEKTSSLKDIYVAQGIAMRIFSEFNESELLDPATMEKFFNYYFYDRAVDMVFPINSPDRLRDDNLMNILSTNPFNISVYGKRNDKLPLLRQSFMDAGKLFKAIDAPTQSLIIQHGNGKEIVLDLCAVAKEFDAQKYYALLKRSQQYSVNIFPNIWKKLAENNAICEIQEGEGIYYLKSEYYSDKFGLSIDQVNNLEFLNA